MALTVDINGDTSGLDKALGKSSRGINAFGRSIGPGIIGVAALAGGAALAAKGLWDMAMAAASDRAAQEKLERTIRRATRGVGRYGDEIEKAIARGQDLAFTDDEVRDSLAILVSATRDVDRSMRGNAIAMDIARLKGVSLEQASKAVAKAMTGNDAALIKLIPGLHKGANAWATLRKATQLARGSADEFSKTTEGSIAKINIRIAELGETIGGGLLPIIDRGLPKVDELMTAIEDLLTNDEDAAAGGGIDWVGLFLTPLDLAIALVKGLDGALDDLSIAFAPLGAAAQPFLDGIANLAASLGGDFATNVIDPIIGFLDAMGVKIPPVTTALDLLLLPWLTLRDSAVALWQNVEKVLGFFNTLLDDLNKKKPNLEGFVAVVADLVVAVAGVITNVVLAILGIAAFIAKIPIWKPIIDGLAAAWGLIASAIKSIEDGARAAIQAITDLLAKLGELKLFSSGFSANDWRDLGPFADDRSAPPTPEGQSAGTRSGSVAVGNITQRKPNVTINILGDPMTIERTVVRSLRDYGRRNGRGLALPGIMP